MISENNKNVIKLRGYLTTNESQDRTRTMLWILPDLKADAEITRTGFINHLDKIYLNQTKCAVVLSNNADAIAFTVALHLQIQEY